MTLAENQQHIERLFCFDKQLFIKAKQPFKKQKMIDLWKAMKESFVLRLKQPDNGICGSDLICLRTPLIQDFLYWREKYDYLVLNLVTYRV